jgi:hypothetical protein
MKMTAAAKGDAECAWEATVERDFIAHVVIEHEDEFRITRLKKRVGGVNEGNEERARVR